MGFHKRKDFAALCKMTPAALGVYIKRGKVILSGSFVDDQVPQNLSFLAFHAAKENKDTSNPGIEPPKIDGEKVKTPIQKEISEEQKLLFKAQEKQISLENEKKQEEINLLRIKKDKQTGASIPTELVKSVIIQLSKSFTTSFHNAADNYLIEIAKLTSLDRAQIAAYRKKLIDIINVAVDEGIKESNKQITNIVNEHSEKRTPGEKE